MSTEITGLKKFNGFITNPNTENYLMKVLGDNKQTFISNITSLVANNKQLQECDSSSIMYAAIRATSLGLSIDPSLGLCAIMPYKDNKNNTTVATFQLQVGGICQLCYRTGIYTNINWGDVREGELQNYNRIRGTFDLIDIPNREKAKVIGYFAYYETKEGMSRMIYKSYDELDAHGKRYSQTYKRGYGLWKDDTNAMMEKTILKMLLNPKRAPMTVELKQALNSDYSVIKENGELQYIDNEKEISIDENKAKEIADKFSEYKEEPEIEDTNQDKQ